MAPDFWIRSLGNQGPDTLGQNLEVDRGGADEVAVELDRQGFFAEEGDAFGPEVLDLGIAVVGPSQNGQ